MKKNSIVLFCCILIVVAFVYRVSSVLNNHPFWVDEFNSAIQGEIYLKNISTQNFVAMLNVEKNNYFSHFLISVSDLILGVSEKSARMPFVVIGSIVPVAIFILAKKYYSVKIALAASLMITFSYFEITWSNQARGYVLQQLLSSMLFVSYLNFLNQKKTTTALIMMIFAALGILTHNMFILVVFAISIHFTIFHFNFLIKKLRHPAIFAATLVILSVFIYTSSIYKVFTNDYFSLFNNLWYYHSLLWREYGLIVFLALIGFFLGLKRSFTATSVIGIFMIMQLIFVTFFFGHYMSKYLLPIFHFIFLFSGIGIVGISEILLKDFGVRKFDTLIVFILTMLIVINGDKFVIKPKAFYSVNHDMRDIAIVDYHRVYKLIKEKSGNDLNNVAIIETWPDRPKWYLGVDFPNIYYFRWLNAGFTKNTVYFTNDKKEKIVEGSGGTRLVGELSDLQMVLNKYPQGFIWIDDSSLPADVIDYVKTNMKQELYLDHYEYDDNPYSIWPATLYSWGFEDAESEPVLQ